MSGESFCAMIKFLSSNPVDTRRRFNVYTTSPTSYRRLIDVETTSYVYWEISFNH